jgi:ribosomal protein L11 methyltransferase
MFELRLVCPESAVEPISDALEALDALSVSAEDADADTEAEQALFGEPGMPPPAPGWRAPPWWRCSRRKPPRRSRRAAGRAGLFAGCQVQAVRRCPSRTGCA